MRPEKKFLVQEASDYLSRSDFFFLTDYKGIDAEETSELRKLLSERGAEFHVVKNSSLRLATKDRELEDFDRHLSGHTAIVFGGDDASSVAKALKNTLKNLLKFRSRLEHLEIEFLLRTKLSNLLSYLVWKALEHQLLSLLNTSSSQLLTVLSAPARGLVTVLKAKTEQN